MATVLEIENLVTHIERPGSVVQAIDGGGMRADQRVHRGYAFAIGQRGRAYLHVGRHKEAVADFTAALTSDPSMPVPWRAAGRPTGRWAATTRPSPTSPELSRST